MEMLKDFFSDLFATDQWPPRWTCGNWSDFHGWLYIISDLMIWFAYFTIPVIILSYIYRKKYELKYTYTYVLFASFILLCGSTHLLDAAMFWTPFYRFNALVRFITGVTSLFTVYHLIRILPEAFRDKTSVVLEREIAKRVAAEEKLEEANQGLKAFAYMASHDLQEPLRKIQMFTGQVREYNEGKLDQKSIEWLDKTKSSATRLERMIHDILSLSSIHETNDFQPTDLNKVLHTVVQDLDIKIQERSAVVRVSDLPTVNGSEQYLNQLFTNLVSNAIKFNEHNPVVEIFSTQTKDAFEIHVKDNGIGIRKTDESKIFEAFQRLNSASKFEGSGIGLAIVKRIVDVHHATIRVESEPGKGTTFIVAFPSAT